jgi:hypothetical protein
MLLFLLLSLVPVTSASAAQMEGVVLPDTRVVDGTVLRLNGIGLRTWSLLGIRIYVAGLYLRDPSTDAAAILRSDEPKLLDIRFLRDVDQQHARDSWRNGLTNACQSPCTLDQHDIDLFLENVHDLHAGDEAQLLFTRKGVDVTFNGHHEGEIRDTHFAGVMLESFIGASPPTARLKRELLGQRD